MSPTPGRAIVGCGLGVVETGGAEDAGGELVATSNAGVASVDAEGAEVQPATSNVTRVIAGQAM
jgi:hypothetical protein